MIYSIKQNIKSICWLLFCLSTLGCDGSLNAPENVKVEDAGSVEQVGKFAMANPGMKVSWNPIKDIDNYEIFCAQSPTFTDSLKPIHIGLPELNYCIHRPTAKGRYYFWVRGVKDGKKGKLSNRVEYQYDATTTIRF